LNRLVPRWCCIDLLNAPDLTGLDAPLIQVPSNDRFGVAVHTSRISSPPQQIGSRRPGVFIGRFILTASVSLEFIDILIVVDNYIYVRKDYRAARKSQKSFQGENR